MSNEIVIAQTPKDLAIQRLDKRELHAYTVWCGITKPPLSPSLQAKLFQLFLNGKTTEEIRRLNPALQLGEIVAARIEGLWDEKRQEHLDHLLRETSNRSIQTTLETADFICDMLAVAKKEFGDKMSMYLQTGNENDLGDFRITGFQGMKTAIEMLQKLSGVDRISKVNVDVGGVVVHRTEDDISSGPTSEQALKVLKLLLDKTG